MKQSRNYICNPAEGSDGRSTVYILLASHVFGQAVKHNMETFNTYRPREVNRSQQVQAY